jgi:membrane-bound serine protease (ClpP class)
MRSESAASRSGGTARSLLALLCVLATGLLATVPARAADVRVLELEGAIGPASADYILRNLEDAEDARAALFVIRMDTPGGLDSSMRDIIKGILDSTVPVATWVAPQGSRAASAGTYILYASHVAAMAPATNLGAATPVSIGGGGGPLPMPGGQPEPGSPDGDGAGGSPEGEGEASEDGDQPGTAPQPKTALERKAINDAVAYIRGLAELRGRNAEWAERAVREAVSLSATEAVAENVADFVAADLDALLAQANGRTVTVQNAETTIDVSDPAVTRIEPDWRSEFLALITDPNIAYILMMIGIYGLILEFYNPGLGIPGITGAICLLLGFYALQMLPVSYAGLGLMFLGIALMVTEALTPSFGVFGVGGAIAFAFGSVMLMDTDLPAFQVSMPIIAAFVAASLGIFVFSLAAALRARREHVVSGREGMIGERATALGDFESAGRVRVLGEVWQARSDVPVRAGQELVVTAVDGLTVHVTPADEATGITEGSVPS